MRQLLDFENEVETIEAKIDELRRSEQGSVGDVLNTIAELTKKRETLLRRIYAKLDDWQICQVARHPLRPQTKDYINALTTDFIELHGDRLFSDDRSIITGIAHFDDTPVFVIGHQKGRGTNEKLSHNFGMSHPEGYRKVLRIMDLADKFGLPIISFVDTPGAYPGIGAEERGQSGAIGSCLRRSAELRVPLLVAVIGEGGSGGALAMAVGDYVAMMQYSIYSVISPEGCASILWGDGLRAAEAAKLLGLTAARLKKLQVIDEIIDEPVGGAHWNPEQAAEFVKSALQQALRRLMRWDEQKRADIRQQRWRNYGVFKEF